MARSTEKKIYWYKMEINHETKQLLEEQYGFVGRGFFEWLHSTILGSEGGHFAQFTEKKLKLTLRRYRIDEAMFEDMLELCFTTGFLDGEKWTNEQILVSADIQDKYLDAANKRRYIWLTQDHVHTEAFEKWINNHEQHRIVEADQPHILKIKRLTQAEIVLEESQDIKVQSESETPISESETPISESETPISESETPISSSGMQQNRKKERKKERRD